MLAAFGHKGTFLFRGREVRCARVLVMFASCNRRISDLIGSTLISVYGRLSRAAFLLAINVRVTYGMSAERGFRHSQPAVSRVTPRFCKYKYRVALTILKMRSSGGGTRARSHGAAVLHLHHKACYSYALIKLFAILKVVLLQFAFISRAYPRGLRVDL